MHFRAKNLHKTVCFNISSLGFSFAFFPKVYNCLINIKELQFNFF